MIRNSSLIGRFLRYVKIDTQSDENSETTPSTMKQHDLAELLTEELTALGASDVYYDREHCYVYARIPAVPGETSGGPGSSVSGGPDISGGTDVSGGPDAPAVGFIAHMDTSSACSGAGVKPRILENYRGGDPVLKESDWPELRLHYGEDLIATDGTTLLGADDKAGVAEIMNLAEYFLSHPEIPHREVRICFTPDEEIGRGPDHFDIGRFGAPGAYTVDGGKLGVYEYENFNAAAAAVTVRGISTHPGDAKNRMVNAAAIAMEFHRLLPADQVPEHTEGREGFYHLCGMEGDVEHASLEYIIRDHDRGKFEARKEEMKRISAFLNSRYGEGTVEVALRDQYYNMKEIMLSHMDLIDRAVRAYAACGVTAEAAPIRGGTDGAQLTFRGLPCPNLSTGGYNYHSRFEFASIQEMEACAEVLIAIARQA